MSAQVAYKNSKAEDWARYRRRDHDDIEAIQNLIIDKIACRANESLPQDQQITCPPKVRAFLSALQSAHGGGQVINEPFARSHEAVATYLQFKGSKTAKEARVRRLINLLESFQRRTGYMLFHVERGGSPTGEVDERGNSIYTATTYTDFLLPMADAAVQRAYESGLYYGDKAKGIKATRYEALAAQVEWALEQLPSIKQERKDKPDRAKLSLNEYLAQQADRADSSLEGIFDGIEERHGSADDCLAFLERLYNTNRRAIESRRKTERARRDFTALEDESDAEADPTNLLPPHTESSKENNSLVLDEAVPDMLKAALAYASEGFAVFPCHTPNAAGVCDCRDGDKCKCPGKHPRIKQWEKCASRDPAQITKWWQKWPHANIAIATGIMSACIVLDVDIDKGGGVGLATLSEKIELPPTMEIQSGTGVHFYYSSEDKEIKNSSKTLGEGLDVRGNFGLIIAPPSLHLTGRRYQRVNDLPLAPLPDALRELMLASSVPQSNVSQFRHRTGQGISRATFPDGERNDGLFRIGCSIWGKGNAEDLPDLHTQLLNANLNRCSPPLDDGEVMKLAANIATRYARGVPINEKDQFGV